jgi:tryptophan-rich sensory protein
MNYSVLTNRKRAVIALVHSVFFFFVALSGLIGQSAIPPLAMAIGRQSHLGPALAITAVYLVVTGILVWLVRFSAAPREKLYFAFCATSAGTGLLRVLFGDTSLHAEACIRVIMLACAIVTCTIIWRSHPAAT